MKSLLSRLTIALCLTALVLLSAGGLVVYLTAKSQLEASFDAVLAAKADALLTTAEVEDGALEIDLEVQAFAGFGSAAGGDYFEFRTAEGTLLARSPSLKRDRLPSPLRKPGRRPHGSDVMLPDGREGRVLWQAAPLEDSERAADMMVELAVASHSGTLRETLRTLAGVLIAVSALGLVATMLVLRRVLRHALSPVEKMAREVHDIDVARHEDVLRPGSLPEELAPVGAKVNELLARARRAMERERSFSSHAAHELRTPLAELRAMTELMSLWSDEVTPARCEEMQAAIARLESLVQKLALLARVDAGQQTVQCTALNLEQSLQAAVERFIMEAQRKELEVRLKASNTDMDTDPVLWDALANNLIENAVSYAPRGSTISIEATSSSLAVSNAAPDLTTQDLDRMGDRFWRKDTGHSAESQTHSGLGLALVSAYAQLLGGRCEFHLSPERIFTVTLHWTPA